MRWSPVLVAALFAVSLPVYAQDEEVEVAPGEEVEIDVEGQEPAEAEMEGEEEAEYRTTAIGSESLPRSAFPFWLEARAGVTIPTSNLADVVDVGFGAGLTLGYYFSPAFALFLNGDWGTLSGITENDVDLPNQGLFNYYLGIGYDLAWMAPSFSVLIYAGPGATTFYINDLNRTDTNFALNFGLKLFFWVADQVAITLYGDADLVFLTQDLQDIDNANTRWLFPAQLGVAFRF